MPVTQEPLLSSSCLQQGYHNAPHGAHCAFEFCGPVGITAGPDGNLWFAATDVNMIGRITPAGSFTEFPLPTTCGSSNGCGPYAITAGPDGNLWFTEAANDIGRITTQ